MRALAVAAVAAVAALAALASGACAVDAASVSVVVDANLPASDLVLELVVRRALSSARGCCDAREP